MKIEFHNITLHSTPLTSKGFNQHSYKLTAEYHLKEFSKKQIYLLLANRKNYMLNHNYYLNGEFKAKNTLLSYKNAYILGNKIHLFNVMGKIDDYSIKAKEIIYDGSKRYLLKHCEVKTSNKIYRRKEFEILISKS